LARVKGPKGSFEGGTYVDIVRRIVPGSDFGLGTLAVFVLLVVFVWAVSRIDQVEVPKVVKWETATTTTTTEATDD